MKLSYRSGSADTLRDGIEINEILVDPNGAINYDTYGQSLQRTHDESDNFASDAPTPSASNICLPKGASFKSLNGKIFVDHIRAGDWIMTYDHGPWQMRWVYTKTLSVSDIQQMPNFAPETLRRPPKMHSVNLSNCWGCPSPCLWYGRIAPPAHS